MRIVVTGSSGWIGSQVVFRAARLGLSVCALDQRSCHRDQVQFRVADISKETVLALCDDPAVARADALIHCAGVAHRPSETVENRALFEAVNHRGTQRMLELARRSGIRRFVYLSSIAFYDWGSGAGLAEDGPLRSTTAYAASKLAGERACLESGLDVRVARLATVFGTDDRANFARLASALAKRRFVIPGQGSARKSVVPVGLVAELLVDLALKERLDHHVINLGLPSTPTLSEICDAYCELCGFPRPPHIPQLVLAGCALCGDVVERLRGTFPLTTSTLRKLTSDTTVNVSRMQSVWSNRIWPDFRTALAESADYYRALR